MDMVKSDLQTRKPSKELLIKLYSFLRDIGMKKEVEASQAQKRENKVKKIFQKLVTDNPYFPNNADVDLMLSTFMDCVYYGNVTLKYSNLRSLLEAFREFATKDCYRGKFSVLKELPPHKERSFAEMTDGEISEMVTNLHKLEAWTGELKSQGYFNKIKQEALKRGLL